MPLHISSTFSHHLEVKIALHSLWYHHTYKVAVSCTSKIRMKLSLTLVLKPEVSSLSEALVAKAQMKKQSTSLN